MVGISELGAVGRTFAVERSGTSDGYAQGLNLLPNSHISLGGSYEILVPSVKCLVDKRCECLITFNL